MVFKHAIPSRLLKQVESENPEERLSALKEIIRRRVRRSDVEPIILNLIKDNDVQVRIVALEALVRFLGEEAISPYLLDALRDTSPEVRLATLAHLKKLNYRSVHDRIEPLLDDPDPRVRMEALRTIVKLRDLAALDSIMDVLTTTSDEFLEKESLEQLQEIVSPNPRFFLQFWKDHLDKMEHFLQKPHLARSFFNFMSSKLLTSANDMLDTHSLVIRAIKDQLEKFLPDHNFTRRLKEIVESYLENQSKKLKEQGIRVRPTLIEGFPGSEEQIVIEGSGLIFQKLSFEPEGILEIEDTVNLPMENKVIITCKIAEKSLMPNDRDVVLHLVVENPRKGTFDISIKIPVKNHGLIGLDLQAHQVLSYLKSNPKPSFEDLLITLEIPSILIQPIFTYLNVQVPLHSEELIPRDYQFYDEISRRLLQVKRRSNEFSLYDLPEIEDDSFKVTIADFKKALEFLQQFCNVSYRDQVDILAEGSSHIAKLSRLAMQLYFITEKGKKKKRIDEVCREINVGPWTLLRAWKYFEEQRNERISFEGELHRTIDPNTVTELNELSRSFNVIPVGDLTLDQWLDYWRFMFFLSRWRFIPIDWFAAHVNSTLLDEIDQLTVPLSELLLKPVRYSFVDLYYELKNKDVMVSPLAVAFYLKLVHESVHWSPEFMLFVRDTLLPKMDINQRTFDEAILAMVDVIEKPSQIPILSFVKNLSMSVLDVIIVKYLYDRTISTSSKELSSPPPEVLNQVMKWISEEDSVSLWTLLKKWSLLRKEGLLVPRNVVQLTLSAMHVFNEQYTIHQLDLTQLSMQERLELNQQAIKLIKILKDNSKSLTPVELANLSGMTPTTVMQVLSYAHSTSELRPLLEKHLKYLQVSQRSLDNQISQLIFISDRKSEIQEENIPKLNKIELKSAKIRIKLVKFSFEWLKRGGD